MATAGCRSSFESALLEPALALGDKPRRLLAGDFGCNVGKRRLCQSFAHAALALQHDGMDGADAAAARRRGTCEQASVANLAALKQRFATFKRIDDV